MAVRNFSSIASPTTLTSSITAGATTMTVASTTGLPSTPFFATIDRSNVSKETVLVTNVAGTTLTITRGQDGTPAVAHDADAVVEHTFTATDAEESNAHINASQNVHGVGAGNSVASDADIATHAALTSNVHGVSPPGSVMAVVPGMMVDWAGGAAPSLWLLCNGSAVSRTTYASLFSVIGTTYGAGDGSTTFNLPNFTNRVARYGTPGATGGADTDSVTLTEANLPSHSHTSAEHSHTSAEHSHTGPSHQHTINHDHPSATTGNDGVHDHDLFMNTNAGGWNGAVKRGANDEGVGQTTGQAIVDSPSHSHSFNVPSYSGTSGYGGTGSTGLTTPGPTGLTTPEATGTTGSGQAFTVDTIPSYTGANKIIFAGV